MEDLWSRIVLDLAGRLDGPLWFRVVMQPSIACVLAIRDGLADARAGRSPFALALATSRGQRAALARDAWGGAGKVFCVAAVLDVAYQWIVFRFVYPGEVLLVASTLALLPYVLVRGLSNRVFRRRPGPVG